MTVTARPEVPSGRRQFQGYLSHPAIMMAFICILLSPLVGGRLQAGQLAPEYAGDHIIIKLNCAKFSAAGGVPSKYSTAEIAGHLRVPHGATIKETHFAELLRRAAPDAKSARRVEVDISRHLYMTVPAGMTPHQCVELMKTNSLVEYAELDGRGRAGIIPSDDAGKLAQQWHLDGAGGSIGRIHAPESWDLTTGTATVIVAVLDSGCDTNNAEFAGRIVAGYNRVGQNNDPADDNGHGTEVASIICANANNGTNGAGVDWNCKLMPVKVLDATLYGEYSWWADGIYWAISNGAKVINLSAGGTLSNITLHTAITTAVARGVIFVTITHNYPGSGITYPGYDSSSITVGSIETTGARSSFSAYGQRIDLVAPGSGISTLGMNDGWRSVNGTSYAAPIVAGAASLVCSLWPEVTQEQMRNLLCAGADEQGHPDTNDTPGFDIYYGWGRLNLENTLVLVDTAISGIAASNDSVTIGWRCPGNAAMRQPFRVERAESITGAWVSATNIAYSSTNASWTDPGPLPGLRFYRVGVRDY